MRKTVAPRRQRYFSASTIIGVALAVVSMMTTTEAAAAEEVHFSAVENVTDLLVQRINAETVRLDISSWYLSEHAVSIAIAKRFAAGVPVRLIGDRVAIFEADSHTKDEYYWLASQGVPIRLRVNPTWFPEIDHWKMALFIGQGIVEFGSGNFAPTELAPVSSTNYSDETELFSDDPELVNAFKTKFDVMWNDTTQEPSRYVGPPYLKDWADACATEPTGGCADFATRYPNAVAMNINTARLEGDNPMPADLIWGQGDAFNNRLTQEILNDNSRIDVMVYRLGVDNITNAILSKFQAGVPVRVIVDSGQYTNELWPEYWLTHANIDKLWAAGVPIRQSNHAGVMHMKTIVTSTYATNASSNFSPNWQRDHDYFVAKATKPAIYQAIADRVDTMWNDTAGFGPLQLTPPRAPDLTTPASNSAGVAVTTSFVWKRASWAVSYDVYLGTSQSNMVLVANVPAQLSTDPPTTYSWTPQTPLQGGTTYFWKVVSRTNATPLAPTMIGTSSIWAFATTGTVGPPPAPTTPAPANGATGVTTTPVLGWSAGAAGTTFNVALGTTNPPSQVATGLTTSSYSPGTLAANTTYFWKVTAVSSGGSTAGPIWSFTTGAPSGGLPSPWLSQDVGSTGLAGSASFSSGTFSVRGAGGNIWGTSDSFQYVYQPLSGDGEIVAHVAGITNTSPFAKAGLMWRETTSAGSAHVVIDLRPTGDIEFMSRATNGGDTSYIAGASQATWLKLTRTGSTITGYVSVDGTSWSLVGTATTSMATSALVGLPVTSQNTSQLNTSTFDNVGITVPTTQPPATPGTPSPANSATSVSASPTLTWTSAGATSYDVRFGTSNPPSLVSADQSAASYAPAALVASTKYFWQIVAKNSAGTTTGPVWSFTTVAPPPPPGTPTSPSPANSATGVSTAPTLTWSSSGATSYDVKFGTSNPPPQVSTGQATASYAPGTLLTSKKYFWQIVAHNSSGTTTGAVWSFTTAAAPPPPGTPASPSPANSATGVSTTPTLTWSSSGATSYDVKFGTSNPPPQVSTGQASASYVPAALLGSQQYFWQIVARNTSASTTGPVWSFTTAAAVVPISEIVIYASDVPASNLHGAWVTANDPTSPNGVKLVTPDNGFSQTDVPLAAPQHYVDVTFNADAGTPYRLWLRIQALNNSKFNDSLWIQFSDAMSGGASIYPLNTTQALDVNLATDAAAGSLNQWGWQNGAYWLSQPTTVTFPTNGTHTMRIQVREDGVQLDQIVLSSSQYLSAAPGGPTNDTTIVAKP